MTYTQHNLHNNIQSYADERGPPHATWYRVRKTKLNKTKKINSQQQFKYFPIYIANFLGPSNTKLSFLVKKNILSVINTKQFFLNYTVCKYKKIKCNKH